MFFYCDGASVTSPTVRFVGGLGPATFDGLIIAGSGVELPNGVPLLSRTLSGTPHTLIYADLTNTVHMQMFGGASGIQIEDQFGNVLVAIAPNGAITSPITAVSAQRSRMVFNPDGNGLTIISTGTAQDYTSFVSSITRSITSLHHIFELNGVVTGSISQPASNSVSFNTTSDERLKLDDGVIGTEAGCIIDRLQPRWFRWKTDADVPKQPGFFAQQVHRAFPWAVTKGRYSEDPWQMDAAKMMPIVIAELIELRKRVKALEKLR